MPAATTTSHWNAFAILLRECRKRAGLSQLQLASYLHVSISRVSKWETGVGDPPRDPDFYQRLQAVPGFSEVDITLLREAAEADESTEVVRKRLADTEGNVAVLDDSASALLLDFAQKLIEDKAETQQKITEAVEKSLKHRAAEAKFGTPAGAKIEVRREGLLRRENPQDRKRKNALKANKDRGTLTAHHLKDLEGFAASGQRYVLDAIEHLKEVTDDLPDELQPIAETLTKATTKIISASYVECLKFLAAWGIQDTEQAIAQATQAALPIVEEAQAPSTKCLPDTDHDAIISSPMPLKEVVPGDHIIDIVTDLQSQATLGSEKERPTHYPHENVVFHVTQLRAEALRRQRAKKRLEKPYQVVATLRQAGEKTGVPHDKIVTTRDIEAEYHINKKLVHEYTRRGREGRPHLTPLSVRLSGGRGGQLLFRREDIERLVANPPSSYKGGRPRK
jgi:transcriptional regulator with XRE-family HTH domain